MTDRPVAGAIARIDAAVDGRVERLLRGRPAADRTFYSLSALGDWSTVWILAGVGLAAGDGRTDRSLRFAAGLAAESILVNGVIKQLFRRTRPAAPTTARPHRLRVPLTSSFPSGHASSGAFAATVLSDRTAGTGAGVLWWTLAAAVAFSRVHVGVHHASDIVGGAVVGRVVGLAMRRTINR